jgi:hypothetical protein
MYNETNNELDEELIEATKGLEPQDGSLEEDKFEDIGEIKYELVLTRLLVNHDYNIYCLKLTPWHHVRLVSIINSSPSLYSIHVITHFRMLSAFTRGTVLLPNDDALPTADASTECFKENLLPNGALLPNSAHMSVSSLYQFLVLTP